MARQGLIAAFPYAVFVNEAGDDEAQVAGVFISQADEPPAPYTPTTRQSILAGRTPTFVSHTASRQANVAGVLLQEEFSSDSYTLAAVAGAVAWTGNASELVGGKRVVGAAGAFVFAGVPADLKRARRLVSGVGEFIYTLASVEAAIAAAAGSFIAAGFDAALTYTPATAKLIAETGLFDVSGQPAGFLWNLPFEAAEGEFAFTGQAATFRRPYRFVGEVGQFALTGLDAELIAPRIIAYPIFPKVITAGPS